MFFLFQIDLSDRNTELIYLNREINRANHLAEVLKCDGAGKRSHFYNVACYDRISNTILRCYRDSAAAATELSLSIREINLALLKGTNYAGIKWGYIHIDETPKLKKVNRHELRKIISIAAYEASVSKTASHVRMVRERKHCEVVDLCTVSDSFEDEIIFPADALEDDPPDLSNKSVANSTGSGKDSPASTRNIVEDSIVYWIDSPADQHEPASNGDRNDIEFDHSTSSAESSSLLCSAALPLLKSSDASGSRAVGAATSAPVDQSIQRNHIQSSLERSFPFYEPDPKNASFGSHFISREKPYYLRNALGFRLIFEAVQVMKHSCFVSSFVQY